MNEETKKADGQETLAISETLDEKKELKPEILEALESPEKACDFLIKSWYMESHSKINDQEASLIITKLSEDPEQSLKYLKHRYHVVNHYNLTYERYNTSTKNEDVFQKLFYSFNNNPQLARKYLIRLLELPIIPSNPKEQPDKRSNQEKEQSLKKLILKINELLPSKLTILRAITRSPEESFGFVAELEYSNCILNEIYIKILAEGVSTSLNEVKNAIRFWTIEHLRACSDILLKIFLERDEQGELIIDPIDRENFIDELDDDRAQLIKTFLESLSFTGRLAVANFSPTGSLTIVKNNDEIIEEPPTTPELQKSRGIVERLKSFFRK